MVTEESVEADQYGDFLCSIFNEWVRQDVGRVFVQLFDVALGNWMGLGSSLCVFAEKCGSALAVEQNAPRLLELLPPAQTVICQQGRVAVGDEIGELLQASLAIVFIGERPGLSAADSMGVYLTWNPHVGRTDAERNCISNIRPEGLSPGAAAELLGFLMTESRRRGLSGVALKAQSSTGEKLESSASRTI